MEPHFRLGVLEALKALRSGRITVKAYCASLAARVAACEPRVGAWAWFDPERLLVEAAARDKAKGPKGALFGLPVGLKDIMSTRGIPTGMGSQIYAGHVPAVSATVATRIEDLGGIVEGKTVTTEFAYRYPGKTRNPWNERHTPGGSSSGSAASVSLGMAPAALGTQTLGSVIRPAAYCGVVGYKPSFGAISRAGIHPFSTTLDHVGVFARSVADAGYVAACLMGKDDQDRATAATGHPVVLEVPTGVAKRAPKLAAIRTPMWRLATEPQRGNFDECLKLLSRRGSDVEEVTLPAAFDEAWDNVMVIMAYDAVQSFDGLEQHARNRMSEPLVSLLDRGHLTDPRNVAAALKKREHYIEHLDGLLERFDAIVTVPATGEAPAGLGNTGDAAFCSLWTQAGMPAITIPSGRGPQGLPLGFQVVGRWRGDQGLLEVAAWCERALGVSMGFPS
jgi:amidase